MKIIAALFMAVLLVSTAAIAALSIAGPTAYAQQNSPATGPTLNTQKAPARQQQTPMQPSEPANKITEYASCEVCNSRCGYGACFFISPGSCICVMCSNCGAKK